LSPSTSQRAALALLDAANIHASIAASPLTWAAMGGRVTWTNGSCDGDGSLQASLDGGPSPEAGTVLPTGSHTYVVAFSDCLVDGWSAALTGSASAAYTAADWSNVSATVSAASVRGVALGFLSELSDVTADGSAAWTSSGSSPNTTTYIPAAGARLVNNSTGNAATFGGGSYSMTQPGNGTVQRFDDLNVALNGVAYTLNGSLHSTFGDRATHTGEVRITSNGTLVARVYGDPSNALAVEILVKLGPF
jgi:hypothetical protein